MPSFTDTSNGYVQWQSARRQAKQLAQDAAIDIIEHYNRVVLNGHGGPAGPYSSQGAVSGEHAANGITDDDTPRPSKKLTPRGQGKKTRTLRMEKADRKGGVFTEGISSLSKQSPFPVSLRRSDILSDNQPDSVMLARDRSRVYLTISHPGPKQPAATKGDQSAKSVRTLPPPSSHPWTDVLSVTEIVRSRTFTGDERADLCIRSTLDSRQTASDVHPASDRRAAGKHGHQLALLYPAITGPPPNTPAMHVPQPHKPKVPAINIVSLDGNTVNDSKKSESRQRLPLPFRGVTVSGPVSSSGESKSSKPGIDLPHLPLRYAADSREANVTPRDRPTQRMNYFMHSKVRRRTGLGHKNTKIMSVITADLDTRDDATDSKTTVTDPYANRFQQTSTVTSLGETYVPVPTRGGEDHHGNREGESKGGGLGEPTIMLTVEEEDESGGDKGSPPAGPPPSFLAADSQAPQLDPLPDVEATPQASLVQQARIRTQSLVSNASLLSVPLHVKDLMEARPPAEPTTTDVTDTIILEIPAQAEEAEQMGSDPFPPPKEDKAAISPDIASTSVIDTARTVATQTSLPYDPDAADPRPPAVLKIKTISMFPDINGSGDGMFPDINGSGDGMFATADQRPGTRGVPGTEPLLRMSHGDSASGGEGRLLLGLPELKGPQLAMDRQLLEEENGGGRKSSGVRNLTFISPLEGQQKAKRF